MDATAAGNSITRKDKDDIKEFLEILEASFKERRCYLGQYEPTSPTTGGASVLSWFVPQRPHEESCDSKTTCAAAALLGVLVMPARHSTRRIAERWVVEHAHSQPRIWFFGKSKMKCSGMMVAVSFTVV